MSASTLQSDQDEAKESRERSRAGVRSCGHRHGTTAEAAGGIGGLVPQVIVIRGPRRPSNYGAGVQTYGVVVVIAWKPSLSKMGLLSLEASTCR